MKIWLAMGFALALLTPGRAAAQEQQHTITMSGHGEAHGQPDTATSRTASKSAFRFFTLARAPASILFPFRPPASAFLITPRDLPRQRR